MSKQKLFSAHDAKLGVFNAPFTFTHVGQAMRAWEEVCKDGKSPFSKFPDDFVLYEIAEFDEDTGQIVAHNPIRRISSALEVLGATRTSLKAIES